MISTLVCCPRKGIERLLPFPRKVRAVEGIVTRRMNSVRIYFVTIDLLHLPAWRPIFVRVDMEFRDTEPFCASDGLP